MRSRVPLADTCVSLEVLARSEDVERGIISRHAAFAGRCMLNFLMAIIIEAYMSQVKDTEALPQSS